MAADYFIVDTEAEPNLPSMFFDQVERLGDIPMVWGKIEGTYQPYSWTDVADQVRAVSAGLKRIGVEPGDRVLIVSENRPEWMIADLAIMALGGVSVPAYTTNTPANHLHLLNDCQAKVAVVSTRQLAANLIIAAEEADHQVELVLVDETEGRFETDLTIHDWAELIADNQSAPIPEYVSKLKRDDLSCLIYTSGTGGLPKGVMLTHGNILHNCYGAADMLQAIGLAKEVFLSFLPLSHAYEHSAGQFLPIAMGSEIYYAERVETLNTNLLEAKPTILTAVPRLYESMRLKILQGLKRQSPTKVKLFNRAVELGSKAFEGEKLGLLEKIENKALDLLVRKKVAERFGGQLKVIVSGGAPLNYDVGLFFAALGLPMSQGYGQTEASPFISANDPAKAKLKSVGVAFKGVDIKIAEDGEILVRGGMVMPGYWNDPDSTARALSSDGWLHTGDVGHLDEDGYLFITDRKKDLIVNSGGDNVSPQRVEGIICLEQEIVQAMVYGDKKPYLTGVIVPDEEFIRSWAKENDASNDLADLKDNAEFKKVIKEALDRSNEQLSTIEKVRRFVIADAAFTVENHMMTPTLKIRRHAILQNYRDTLEALY